jgi:hypothetical protein
LIGEGDGLGYVNVNTKAAKQSFFMRSRRNTMFMKLLSVSVSIQKQRFCKFNWVCINLEGCEVKDRS